MYHVPREMAGGSIPQAIPAHARPRGQPSVAEKRGRVENLNAIVVSEDDVKKQKLSASRKQQTAPRK